MSLIKVVTLLLTTSSPAGAVGAPASSARVTALPGWEGELPSAHYSGYVAVAGGTKQLHYYLQEADTDAESKPLLLWCALLQLCSTPVRQWTSVALLTFAGCRWSR